jgi:putative DNA primase/helicase
LAVIEGKRLVVTSEPQSKDVMNEAVVKKMTGNEAIMVESKGKQPYPILPVCKLWITANAEMQIDDKSNAVFSRMKIIPFNADFRGSIENKNIEASLLSEAEGVLLWMLKGLKDYRDLGGLIPPAEITEYADSVKQTSNELVQFVADRIEENSKTEVMSSALYQAYLNWADANNYNYPLSQKRFSAEMRVQFRYIPYRKTSGMFFKGITLKTPCVKFSNQDIGFNN